MTKSKAFVGSTFRGMATRVGADGIWQQQPQYWANDVGKAPTVPTPYGQSQSRWFEDVKHNTFKGVKMGFAKVGGLVRTGLVKTGLVTTGASGDVSTPLLTFVLGAAAGAAGYWYGKKMRWL